jgi:transposase, IS30 family
MLSSIFSIIFLKSESYSGLQKQTKDKNFNIYFAYPYHSWERGTNENTNGLLREYFPKKSLFKQITQAEIDRKVKLINDRPRKRLNYRTPEEVFNRSEKIV